MAKKTPSDDEIRKRFGVQLDGLDKAEAKKMAAFQVDMVHFAKDVREYLEPGPGTDSVWDAMDTLQKRIASAIKDPQAANKPGPKAGSKPGPKPGTKKVVAASDPAGATGPTQVKVPEGSDSAQADGGENPTGTGSEAGVDSNKAA